MARAVGGQKTLARRGGARVGWAHSMSILSSRAVRVYLIPGAVFQSVVVAGGYGTGRELVEYFTRYGPTGGLLGMAVTVVCWAAVLGATFEFARLYGAYDYRTFFRALIGRAWVLFEVLFILMFLLVLAVVGSAAGEILRESFGLPVGVGLVLMLGLVATLAFFGREVITRSLALWTVALYVVFVAYFVAALLRFGPEIGAGLAAGEVGRGWAVSGFTYAMYNLAIVPAILFAVRGIETRREAFAAGGVAAVICIIPALLFHITFVAGYPGIVEQTLPVYAMIGELGLAPLLALYVIGLFGTFIETGAGFIQGINERIDAYLVESRGTSLGKPARAAIAIVGIGLSLALGTFGLIALIARGYGTIAWGFFAVYVVPIMTYGVYRIVTGRAAGAG
jgi:uncharacterized membrane protein YkvI